jgi:hypothetical protein
MGTGAMELPSAPGPGKPPDLRSLVPSSTTWPETPVRPPASSAPMAVTRPPPTLANGSNNTPSPFAPERDPSDVSMPPPRAEEPSAVVRLVQQSQQLAAAANEPIYDSAFGAPYVEPQRTSRAGLIAAVIAAVVVLAGGGIGLGLYLNQSQKGEPAGADEASGTGDTPPAPDPVPTAVTGPGQIDTAAPPVTPAVTDMETGFDVIVDPPGARIRLDGGDVGPAPRRVRNIAPGPHVVEIDAPGFTPQRQEVTVVAGTADVVRVELQPLDIIGRFTSEPPGAKVALVADGVKKDLGPAPAEAKLDPRKQYEVTFKKAGYVTVTRPVTLTGEPDVNVAVVMERSSSVALRPDRTGRPDREGRGSDSLLGSEKKDEPEVVTPPRREDKKDEPEVVTPPRREDKKDEPEPEGFATLDIGSKPPCQIYVDGKDTGEKTPKRGFKVRAGTRKITLVNNEFKIKKTIRVDLEPGQNKKIIEDFMK